jgi:hypothetical protein
LITSCGLFDAAALEANWMRSFVAFWVAPLAETYQPLFVAKPWMKSSTSPVTVNVTHVPDVVPLDAVVVAEDA